MKFRSLRWIKSEQLHLVQGVKGNRRPYGAMYGGNGSFMVSGPPAQLILTLEDSNGRLGDINVIDIVKATNNWQKLSENRVMQLESMLMQKGEIDVNDLSNELKLN